MFRKHVRNEKGFTMIEMMVVLIIIAVLIGGGIKFYLGYIENSKVTKAKANITVMQAALDAYYSEHNKYPSGSGDSAGTDLTTALLNAGVKGGDAESGTKSPLVEIDPWGGTYVYECDADGKFCEVYTGYAEVQKPDDGKAYVVGRNAKGSSTAPQVEAYDGVATTPVVATN